MRAACQQSECWASHQLGLITRAPCSGLTRDWLHSGADIESVIIWSEGGTQQAQPDMLLIRSWLWLALEAAVCGVIQAYDFWRSAMPPIVTEFCRTETRLFHERA